MATPAVTDPAPDPDVPAIVHEEVDRLPEKHRLPVVLCDLEGLTYEQAADRLRWTVPTLRCRLARARQQLQGRLTRRGITAGAVGAVLAAQAAGARAAVPAALARSAVAIATGGANSAAVAALSATLIRSLFMTKLKIAAAGVLAATTMATAGVVAVGAWRADEPKPAMKAPGTPQRTTAAAPTSPRDDRPKPKVQAPAPTGPAIEGRIVDLEGRPVAGAQVSVSQLWSPPEDGPAGSAARPAATPGSRLGRWLEQARDRGVEYPWSGLMRLPVNLTAATDRDGRFRLTGVGPDQLADIFVSAPTIATAELYAMSRDGDEVRAAVHGFRGATPIIYHARQFQYAVAPGKPIEGLVRDQDSGRPIAGVVLSAAVYEEHSLIPAPGIEAKTDAQGHYRLTGLPRAPAYRLFAHPDEGKPYPNATLRVEGDTPGFDPVKHDFALKRGVLLRGRVTDKATGRPVGGYVNVYAFADNPHVDEFPGFQKSYGPHAPIKDGQYEVVALPGHGVIGCRAADMNLYRGYVGAEAIKGYDSQIPGFHTRPHYCNVWNYNAVAELNLDPKAETATLDIQVDPGRTVVVNPVDPDGKPVAGTMAAGLGDLFSSTEYPQPSTKVEIHALDPSRPRRVIVRDPGRKLIGTVYLKGDETGPLTLRLQPYGTIAGRVVDDEGRPMGGVRLSSAGGSFPERPGEQGILPGGNIGIGILIGKDGRFRIEGLVPGLEYGGSGFDGKMTAGELFRDVTVAPGEVKDLGDLKIMSPRKGN